MLLHLVVVLILLLAPQEVLLTVGRIRAGVRILRVDLIRVLLMQEHHALFATGDDDLFVVGSLRGGIMLSVGTHLNVAFGEAIRRDGALRGILDGKLVARFAPETFRSLRGLIRDV